MASFIYVDNSNVWIEGMRVAAVDSGLASDIVVAQQRNITEQWRIDFGRLLQIAAGDGTTIGRAVLYGSRPPANDSLWGAAKARGFEVIVHDRSVSGREKKIDTHIVTDIVTDSYERMASEDEVALVAGDGDYVPTVRSLVDRGFRFRVVFWEHASRELRSASTAFTSLNPYLRHLEL